MMLGGPDEREGLQSGQALTEKSGSILPVGRVVKAHGIRGEIKVRPYSGDPGALSGYSRMILTDPANRSLGFFRLIAGRVQGRLALLKLAGVDSREQAEAMAGCEIWVEKAHLPSLAEEEFYWQEMEGRRVVTTDGRELGQVSGLLATGAHDILVVTGCGREYLIPAIREFMVESGEKTGIIVIRPVPGLLEIND